MTRCFERMPSMGTSRIAIFACVESSVITLGGQSKPATEGHFKTGQGWSLQNRPTRVKAWDVDSDMRCCSFCRHEQRLERSETTTSNSPGTTGMAVAAHRAGDRGAARNS